MNDYYKLGNGHRFVRRWTRTWTEFMEILVDEGPGQGGEGYEPDPETSGLPVPLPPPGK